MSNRAASARDEIGFALDRRDMTGALLEKSRQGLIPERVTHNDTKLNNVMLDDETNEGICVIDLDTVMPGLVLYDFGDMVRTATSPSAEDERDLSKVTMQMGMFRANMQNISDTLGQFLLPAWSSFLQGINVFLSTITSAISEGGAFYPVLVNIGVGLSLLADGFQGLAHRASYWLEDLNLSWASNVGGIAQDAISWGAEIVTNFAVGIIDAANTVLTIGVR